MSPNAADDSDDVSRLEPTDSLAKQGVGPAESLVTLPRIRKPDSDQPATDADLFIGPYRLLTRIATGGMGEVWLAEQERPVRRQVAIKLIKSGLGSAEIITRFEGERQALALMNHPNIARILDAGTTQRDQPYFVMELISGTPVTAFCDEHRLSIEARLSLFLDVCAGVQHAHQKGIIHRDLKPNNILVSLEDGRAVAKVIDFGLAKAIESTQRLTEQSLATGLGQILGTLMYMSPEQASLEQQDIDTRTDIYALGVILYELLCGVTPFESELFRSQALLSLLEMIRDQEPSRPSSRLARVNADALKAITNSRLTDKAKLQRVLSGDLDWIVMKALSKERSMRYDTVSSMASDITRYLNCEPVTARPPALGYQLKKFVRKHRYGVISAALLVLALLGGIIGTTIGMAEATRQQKIASEELVKKIEALQFARKGNDVLASVFTDLDPYSEYRTAAELRGAMRDNLKKAIAEIQGTSIGNPLEVAQMQTSLGSSLLGLGVATDAIGPLEKCVATQAQQLGKNNPLTLSSQHILVNAYRNAGRLEDALSLARQTLQLRIASLGAETEDTITSMNILGMVYKDLGQSEQARETLEQALAIAKSKLSPENSNRLTTMDGLGQVYVDLGNYAEAIRLHEEVQATWNAQPGLRNLAAFESMNSLAEAYLASGDIEKGLKLFAENYAQRKELLGADHPATLTSSNNLAMAYLEAGRVSEARQVFQDTLAKTEAKLGTDHPDTLDCMNNMAMALRNAGEIEEAIALFEETLKRRVPRLGQTHPDTLRTMNNLAIVYGDAKQLDKSIDLLKETWQARSDNQGPRHPDTLNTMNSLAMAYRNAGQFDQAADLAERSLAIQKEVIGETHPETFLSMINLAMIYRSNKQLDKALPHIEPAARGMEKLKFQHQYAAVVIRNTIRIYEDLMLWSDADGWREKWAAFVKADQGESSAAYASELAAMGRSLLNRQAWLKAEEKLRQCLEIRAKLPDDWSAFDTKSMLGGALAGQNKYAEAERFLIEGCEGLIASQETIPKSSSSRLAESVQRVIQLYQATNAPDKAQKYEQLLKDL